MLNESKKLFPHWLDKSDNSNFTKHLKILNNQQSDVRHKLKTIEWSKLLNKPLQIHKTQTEPHKWKIEFEANVPRLKKVNIYKNPTIVDNEVINSYDVINGYYYDGSFYEHHSKQITNLLNDNVDDETNTYEESEYAVSDEYTGLIQGVSGKYYYDLFLKEYYIYNDGVYSFVSEDNVPQTSLIYSQSFIDNYSHFFRYVLYEDNNSDVIIQKYIVDEDNNQKYKIKLNYDINEDTTKNGKYELNVVTQQDEPVLYYNITTDKYCVFKNGVFVEVDDEKIVWTDNISSVNVNNNDGIYYIFTESTDNLITSRIPLIESVDISPIISNDKYVMEIYTWNDYHFLKGFPEIDFIDYNNNNIIEDDEKTYDNLNINIETIANNDYLTFRVHQFGIKLVEIFKDNKPIHKADFVIEKLGFSNKNINDNFAHIYNYNDNQVYYPYRKDTDAVEEVKLDVDEYVWRYLITEDDKIYDNNGNFELKNKYDIKVTYYDSLHPYNSEYDKILTKTYVCEDSIFYHDVSLDMIGKLYNLPRYVFRQPFLETYEDKIEFYNNTYPTYCDFLSEDDYHYQKRLEYYINHYNKIYFPCLELWKYFHIDSELVNRKVIVAEQNYSYMRTLDAEEDKYINELGKNKAESFYSNNEYVSEEEESVLNKPRLKSIISPNDYEHSRNGILVDEDDEYIKDITGTPVRIDYEYAIDTNGNYVIKFDNVSRTFYWYNPNYENSLYQIKLTDSLRVVPNTRYQLRFCVKEYPKRPLNLRLVYKNDKGDVREVLTSTPVRQDYDEEHENNELIYSDYKKEWEIECEYICTDFLTLANAQNLEICLESERDFKISDVTLQRVTINHFDSEYMKTSTDYNSCVYDLYANYNDIPSNIKYENLDIFNKILNRSLPLSKTGYFNFAFNNTDLDDNMDLVTESNIYIDNMLDVESGILTANDYATISQANSDGLYVKEYNFNKYVKTGDYEILFKPYLSSEEYIIFNVNIEIDMIVFTNDNHAVHEKLIIDNIEDYYDNENKMFKIPFENKSDNSFKITLYRDEGFSFKNFKLVRKAPLTMEEIIL